MIVIPFNLLLPDIPGIQLEELKPKDNSISLQLASSNAIACCPVCNSSSRQIHSSYYRKIEDLPWNAIPVLLTIKVRRFFCINQQCQRKIFAERLTPEISVYARRTKRLYQKLTDLAFELGGKAGTFICTQLGMPCSPSSLIRYIRKTPLPPEGQHKKIGVDEWAIRKGQSYGTIVIDLESHRPVALLKDRTKETFAAWLERHPEVEVISRDRGSAFSQAAEEAAPQAIQAADRFHLLQNLAGAIQRIFERYGKELKAVARRIAENEQGKPIPAATGLAEVAEQISVKPGKEAHLPAPLQGKAQSRGAVNKIAGSEPETNQRQLNFEQVQALHQQHYSQRAIAAHLGLHRDTVRKYVKADSLPKRGSKSNLSSVAPHLEYLKKRWQSGVYNKRQLWLEIQQQGYTGGISSVYRALEKFPPPNPDKIENNWPKGGLKPLPKLELRIRDISAKRATWWVLHDDEKLKPPELERRKVLFELCPIAIPVFELTNEFKKLIRERQAGKLDEWLKKAEKSGIGEFERFAKGLKKDYQAVKTGVEQEFSNGQTEGQITRLKYLKRAMFGRAKFDLLSRKVLYSRAS